MHFTHVAYWTAQSTWLLWVINKIKEISQLIQQDNKLLSLLEKRPAFHHMFTTLLSLIDRVK